MCTGKQDVIYERWNRKFDLPTCGVCDATTGGRAGDYVCRACGLDTALRILHITATLLSKAGLLDSAETAYRLTPGRMLAKASDRHNWGEDIDMIEIAGLGRSTNFLLPSSASVVEQAGALCLREVEGVVEVLLVSSLRSGRWGIPKGHVEADESGWAAAEREAFEEAGIRGAANRTPIGGYIYRKFAEPGIFYVRVHLIDVQECSTDYPERELRTTKWVPLEAAVRIVSRRGLRKILQETTSPSR